MLINLKQILDMAEEGGYAIPAFNVYNMETVMGIIRAAEEALSGVSNVGDMTHFRRNNGREGLVIGNHVFY